VSATVDGEDLWFESSDAELAPAPEALASACLIPAMNAGEDLHIEAPLCQLWQANAAEAQEVIHRWWQFEKIKAQGSKSQKHPCDAIQEADTRQDTQQHTQQHKPRAKTGIRVQCFTGRAASFFSLLQDYEKPDFIVYVYGFDISLGDDNRLAADSPALSQIDNANEASAITISTNLRSIERFDEVS